MSSEDQSSTSDLETGVSIFSDEIAGLRDDLTEIEESRRKRSEVTRVQRAHLIVALSVIGSFVTLYTSSDGPFQLQFLWTTRDPIYALLIHAVLFMIYVPTHLYLITTWTLPAETKLDAIHDLVLPFVNLFLLLGSLPLVLLIALDLDFLSILENIRLLSDSSILLINPISYILMEIVVFTCPAYKYAKAVEKNMSDIQTGSKSRRLHLSAGPSGDSARVTVTNNSDHEVAGEDIRLEIETPRGVIVEDIRHTKETDSGYELLDDLESRDSVRLPIELGEIPGVKYNDYRGSEVKVDILINGEQVSTEKFTL